MDSVAADRETPPPVQGWTHRNDPRPVRGTGRGRGDMRCGGAGLFLAHKDETPLIGHALEDVKPAVLEDQARASH